MPESAPSRTHSSIVDAPVTLKGWNRAWLWLLALAAAAIPVSLLLPHAFNSIAPAIAFLGGIYLLVAKREIRACFARAWPVVGAIVLLIAYTSANVLLRGQHAGVLDGTAHMLLYLVIAAGLATRLDLRIVSTGLGLTTIGLGVFCIIQHFFLGAIRPYSPIGGTSSAIELAEVLIGLALISLVQLLHARRRTWWIILHGVAVVLGLYAALLTRSRGPLLSFIPALIVVLALYAWYGHHWRRTGVMFAAFVVLAVGTGTLGPMRHRLAAIGQQIQATRPGDPDGSVGLRLAMWRVASRAIGEHPWKGIGVHRYHAYLNKEIAAGRASRQLAHFNNPHNMYLGAAVAGGIPGLIVLLLVFLAPLLFFLRHARAAQTVAKQAAWCGIAIVVLYAFCALTDAVFYRILSLSFYFFVVPGLALLIAARDGTRPQLEP